MSVLDFSDLQQIGGPGVQNMWAVVDGNLVLLARGRGVKVTAGEALDPREIVYLNPATVKVNLGLNDDRPLFGITSEAADVDTETFIQTEGLVIDDQPTPTWNWTPGDPIYASTSTPGGLTQTPTGGVYQPPVAIALSAVAILLLPAGFGAATQAPITEILEGSPTPEVLTFGNIDDGQVLMRDGSEVRGETLDFSDPPATQILEGSPTPAVLDIGAIPDGYFLKRSGSEVVGVAGSGAGWTRIYNDVLAAPATSVTIPDLDGDADYLYKLVLRIVSGASATTEYYARPNNDSTTSNYGYQVTLGISSAASAARATTANGLILASTQTATGRGALAEMLIHALSGRNRLAIVHYLADANGTTINADVSGSGVWANSGDNITSLVLWANQTNGFGVGTVIELWRAGAP